MPSPLEPLLAPKDVARFLSCSVPSVRRLIVEGHLRPLRIAGKRALRFRREQVEALVVSDPPRKPRGPTGGGTPSGGSAPPTP
jgi:excisionase family DNA binding protein